MKFYGAIYCHKCLITGLRYFGSVFFGSEKNFDLQQKKIFDRWNAGFGYAHYETKFGLAVREYGFLNFTHQYKIFTFTAEEEYEAEEKLRNLERAFITAYDTVNHGYNSRCGKVYYDVYDIEDAAFGNWVIVRRLQEPVLHPKYVRLKLGINCPTNWNIFGKYGKSADGTEPNSRPF